VAGTRHLLWRKTALLEEAGLDPDKAPETWQELDEMADAVRAELPDNFLLEHNHTSGSHPPFLVWMTTNNGTYINDEMTKITFNSPEGLQTLEWMLQFVKRQADRYERMAAAEAERMNSLDGDVWVASPYVCATAGPWYFLQLKDADPDMEYALELLPHNGENPDAKSSTPSYAGWAFCIPTGAEEVDAAWEWIKFMTAGMGQYGFMKWQTRPSVVRAHNEDPEFSGGNPWWEVVMSDLDNNRPIPVFPQFVAIRDLIYDMTDAVLFEKQTPQEALDEAEVAAQELLDEWLAG
jgi:multiple sugar transport system substrate-binding protein